jgi:hypothetical protein
LVIEDVPAWDKAVAPHPAQAVVAHPRKLAADSVLQTRPEVAFVHSVASDGIFPDVKYSVKSGTASIR